MGLFKKCDNDTKSFSFLHSGKRTLPQEKRFALGTLLWAICLIAYAALIKNGLIPPSLVLPLTLVPIVLLLVPIYLYGQFVKCADELIQKIQLQSLCIAFGFTLFYSISRLTLVHAGFESGSVKEIVMVMAFSWSAAQVYCMWKYR